MRAVRFVARQNPWGRAPPPGTCTSSRRPNPPPHRWNFTPAPGWSREEVQILRLCLMKHGVGQWMQILSTGLLPGKLIQQLNGQTQRLLGQQSLAGKTNDQNGRHG